MEGKEARGEGRTFWKVSAHMVKSPSYSGKLAQCNPRVGYFFSFPIYQHLQILKQKTNLVVGCLERKADKSVICPIYLMRAAF